jgi:hypothetical protein
MEDWQIDFEWLHVRNSVKDSLQMDKLPDLQTVLFLIGIQELALLKDDYTKEEKRDLMHVAVCELLMEDGYYELEGLDQDGWPHYKLLNPLPHTDLKAQEQFLKTKVIYYFKQRELI